MMSSSPGHDPSPARRRHIIHFGHPYSCTPALNAIFEFNRSPSHSEVTQIMKQTGLKRKQLTSWFWRKRKELSNPLDSSSTVANTSDRSRSPGVSNPPEIKPYSPKTKCYGKVNRDEDDGYRPSSHLEINTSSNSCRRSSSQLTRAMSTDDQMACTSPPKLTRTKLPDRSFKSPSHLPCLPCIPSPSSTREPLLIRCRLRPPTERATSEAARAELDDRHEPSKDELVGKFPIPKDIDHPVANELTKNPDASSLMQQPAMSSDFSVTSMQNNGMFSKVNEPSGDHRKGSAPRHCQFDFEMVSQSQEHTFPATRRVGSSGRLRSDRRLSHSHTNMVDTVSGKISNTPRNRSGTSDPDTSDSTEATENICLRVTQDEPNLISAPNSNLLSVGQEVHRWSEISNIDCASRYSCESFESKSSCCTNAAVEDYSALLSTFPMRESPTPPKECPTESHLAQATNGPKSQDVGGTEHFSTGLRYISNTFRPLEQTTRSMSRLDETGLPFNSPKCHLNDTSEIEQDPRLLMWQHDHQEFLNLLDWNPLGGFLNKSY